MDEEILRKELDRQVASLKGRILNLQTAVDEKGHFLTKEYLIQMIEKHKDELDVLVEKLNNLRKGD